MSQEGDEGGNKVHRGPFCFFSVLYALSIGTLGFAVHGSFLNPFLIGGN